ncbi:MAG: DUF1295 domain-containing protein [Nannocystaceae bacterium]
MSPFEVAVVGVVVAAAFCWIAAEVTGEHSWIDRLWSWLPPLYVTWFAAQTEFSDPRLLTMAILAALWGGRLTYNFARKGGYRAGGEDYRWIEMRKRMSPSTFRLFNAVFIAGFQNVLLFLLALPAWVALTQATPWGPLDTLATVLFTGFLVGETLADEQQWQFHQQKHVRSEAGVEGPQFCTTGLFRLARHPNFLCEMAIWWSFYLFSVSAGAGWLNPTIAGPLLLTALIQGSTSFTESLSLAKYPEYAEYQKSTPRLLPRLFRRR